MSFENNLQLMDELPPLLASTTARTITEVFRNPTLITLKGVRPQPLFLSLLLHGNETTSVDVLKHIYASYASQSLPRALMIFVGNVGAAVQGQRYLRGQRDFNRIWGHGSSPEHAIAQRVLEIARKAMPFASIDIHNNTGSNPIYGCVNALRPADLSLASLFAPIGVYYQNPSTTQSIAFSHFCPSITIECGRSGDPNGLAAAVDLVERAMRLERFPDQLELPKAFRLFETIGRVMIDPSCEFDFHNAQTELKFPDDLETWNFKDIEAGFRLAHTCREDLPLKVVDEHDADLTSEFLQIESGDIRTTRPLIPSMITHNKQNIRQDCLCYFMRELALSRENFADQV